MIVKDSITTITVHKHVHILAPSDRLHFKGIPSANYRNTGYALAGILRQDETLEMFWQRVNETHQKNMAEAMSIPMPTDKPKRIKKNEIE